MGLLTDSTVTAIAVEGNSNTIGRSSPASRMLIGGTGYTSLPAAAARSKAILPTGGAVIFTGRQNSLINSTINITNVGDAALNPASVIGVYVHIPFIPIASAAAATNDLLVDSVVAAGYQNSVFAIDSFDQLTINNTLLGSDITGTSAIPSGIGLNLANQFSTTTGEAAAALPTTRGDLMANRLLASATVLVYNLG